MSVWLTGVAEVTGFTARGVIVRCPHCGQTHQHQRASVGSAHVVAGCHRGFSVCREYRLRDFGAQRRAPRKVHGGHSG